MTHKAAPDTFPAPKRLRTRARPPGPARAPSPRRMHSAHLHGGGAGRVALLHAGSCSPRNYESQRAAPPRPRPPPAPCVTRAACGPAEAPPLRSPPAPGPCQPVAPAGRGERARAGREGQAGPGRGRAGARLRLQRSRRGAASPGLRAGWRTGARWRWRSRKLAHVGQRGAGPCRQHRRCPRYFKHRSGEASTAGCGGGSWLPPPAFFLCQGREVCPGSQVLGPQPLCPPAPLEGQGSCRSGRACRRCQRGSLALPE